MTVCTNTANYITVPILFIVDKQTVENSMVEIIVTDLLDRVRERTARDAKNQLFNAGNIKMMFETRYIKPCQHVH